MPARKRRHDVTSATAAKVRAEAEIAGLHEAAARAGRLFDWLQAARPQVPLADAPAVEAPAAAARRRSLWPFGRKVDPEAERQQAILAELNAATAGRPSAVERARDQAPAAQSIPLHDRQRAAS